VLPYVVIRARAPATTSAKAAAARIVGVLDLDIGTQ
jgi:hypothetical protein